MLYATKLKEFCDKYSLDFPVFQQVILDNQCSHRVLWYDYFIYRSNYNVSSEKSLIECITFLSGWCENESNLVFLFSSKKGTRMLCD
jgi:hypothetical protein